jgi:ATP-dependent helicase HrpA
MGKQLTGYPALVDQQTSVAIRLFDTRQAAEENMRAGVRRLLRFELKDRMKQLEKNLPGLKQAALQLTTLIHPDELKRDMLTAITDRAFVGSDALPRNEKEFIAQKKRARTRLPAVTEALAQIMQKIGGEVQTLLYRLSAGSLGNERLIQELNMQLRQLLFSGFLSVTPWERLQHFPRYLKGMGMRLEKFSNNPQRDGQHSVQVVTLWNQYMQRMEKHRQMDIDDPNLTEFRWQIEELRISLFAQELKTPMPVSVKRLQRLWEKVQE